MNSSTHHFKQSQFVVSDPFWGRYMELVRTKVIPYQWEALNDRIPGAEPSYAMYNFRAAAGLEKGPHKGPVFQDSDWGKWIEAVGYVLAWQADPELEKIADEAIDIVCASQQPDGYLNTYYILTGLDKRWTNLMDHHELYCLGHILEGAIAYYEATGKDKLLKAMIRYVDLVDKNFGPDPDKRHGYPGHEVIEMALVRLHDITRDERHLSLAKYFIEERGKQPLYFKEECEKYGNKFYWADDPNGFHYYQAALPVREQRDARGHAVRAVYLYAGMADVARKTQDPTLLAACKELWQSVTERQMYITGSIGASPHGEAFSFDYDLPNDTIYGETCAAIGLVFFARRMLENVIDSQYADVMERALYNGVISGMSLDGQSFFYVNPLEVLPEASRKDTSKFHVKTERQKWFGCACCPPNLARLLASLGSYAYTTGDDGALFMHIYLGGRFTHSVNNRTINIKVDTRYPWDGEVTITLSPESPVAFVYALRIPGWCASYTLTVNNKVVSEKPDRGYIKLSREWKAGDTISVNFDMPVRVNMANPKVREDLGKVALSRGPVVYCMEEADNGPNLHLVSLGENRDFQIEYKPDVLNGVAVITGEGQALNDEWPEHTLYQEASPMIYASRRITWVPYYAWANRGPGEMLVWIRR
ncbi:MAG: glycoside hydrolase family 127 protein [Treponema sp.]|jgi:DUF1680 family protein|nr:glycoside hydrolase family 127 protein [Treponema sp.]